MIYRIFFVGICLFNGWLCYATQEIVEQAHAFYEQQQFEQALSEYQKIEHKSAATWYNMGNCCYKLAQYPKALAYWRRAQLSANAEQEEAIEYNISALHTQVKKTMQPVTIVDFFGSIIRKIPFIVVQLLFLLVSFLIVWLLSKSTWRNRLWLLVLIIIFEVVLTLILVLKYREHSQQCGIINECEVAVYAGPDVQYHALAKVPLLDALIIEQTKPGWCKIRYKDLEGWVCADKIERV